MKKLICCASLVACACCLAAQPLFTYGKKIVTKEDFLRQFNRNLNPTENRVKALTEYLPLFVNYKLKVQDAYDKRLDTLPTQRAELADFRKQIEDNYFSQEANLDELVNEAFNRSQTDIKLQDIFIAFNPKDPASITTAEKMANEAMAKLKAKTDFDKVLSEYSTDADLKQTNGDIGWVTPFLLPYKLEVEAYKLKVGEHTQPIRTKTAFHIIKKNAERKAVGRLQVAQILFAYPPNPTPEIKINLQHLADSVYNLLLNKAEFSNLAFAYSNDKTSYQNGGVLPEFGIGTYDKIFEENAFALANAGSISKPFATNFGIHILKLITTTPVETNKADAAYTNLLKQRVLADNRMEEAKYNLVKKLLIKINYKPAALLNTQALWRFTDSAAIGATTATIKEVNDKTELFSFATQSIKAADWIRFIKAVRTGNNQYADMPYQTLLEQYTNVTAAEYYKSHLENYNPEFKHQVQEFKDANLNFDITQKTVWDRAAEDTLSQKKYYAANKGKYQWLASANAIIFTCSKKELTATIKTELEQNIANWKTITSKYEGKLLADSNRFEQNQLPIANTQQLMAHTFTPVYTNPQDSSQTFCYMISLNNQPGQRSFEEAKGFVINDYQQLLEAQWVAGLKKKYPVKMNEALWQTLLKTNE